MDTKNPMLNIDQDELTVEAIDLGGIDILEEDLVPCTCCGDKCNCS